MVKFNFGFSGHHDDTQEETDFVQTNGQNPFTDNAQSDDGSTSGAGTATNPFAQEDTPQKEITTEKSAAPLPQGEAGRGQENPFAAPLPEDIIHPQAPEKSEEKTETAKNPFAQETSEEPENKPVEKNPFATAPEEKKKTESPNPFSQETSEEPENKPEQENPFAAAPEETPKKEPQNPFAKAAEDEPKKQKNPTAPFEVKTEPKQENNTPKNQNTTTNTQEKPKPQKNLDTNHTKKQTANQNQPQKQNSNNQPQNTKKHQNPQSNKKQNNTQKSQQSQKPQNQINQNQVHQKKPQNQSTAQNTQDPTQTLSALKNSIKNFVDTHNDKIKFYEEEIETLRQKILDEKNLLKNKKAEFRKMLHEIQDITGDFTDNKKHKN